SSWVRAGPSSPVATEASPGVPGGGPPGRISRSAVRSSAWTAAGRPWGRTPPAARCSARLGSGQSTVSWPPKTREDSGGRPQSAKSAVSVTMPVGGWRPAATAAQPVTAVVATEPRAPMSQTPKRAAGGGVGRNGSADMGSLLVVREPGVSRRRRGRAGAGPRGPGGTAGGGPASSARRRSGRPSGLSSGPGRIRERAWSGRKALGGQFLQLDVAEGDLVVGAVVLQTDVAVGQAPLGVLVGEVVDLDSVEEHLEAFSLDLDLVGVPLAGRAEHLVTGLDVGRLEGVDGTGRPVRRVG